MIPPGFLMSRRQSLAVGAAGVAGSALPLLTTPVSAAPSNESVSSYGGKAKTVLIVHLSGGLSQLDSLDMKPQAAAEIRGEFNPIDTAAPGIQVCEHLPKLAQQMDRWSILRTIAHPEHNHLLATHVALTGRAHDADGGVAGGLVAFQL